MKKGFTLIELLVVTAIIALLISILMPSLHKAKEMAGLVSCASNQHQLIVGVSAYSGGNNGDLPYTVAKGGRPSVLNRKQDLSGGSRMVNESKKVAAAAHGLLPYLTTAEVFNCPLSDFAANDQVQTPNGIFSYQELYEDPTQGGNFSLDCSYLLLWNYEGFREGFKGGFGDKAFVGPSKKSNTKLLTGDAFFFSGAAVA